MHISMAMASRGECRQVMSVCRCEVQGSVCFLRDDSLLSGDKIKSHLSWSCTMCAPLGFRVTWRQHHVVCFPFGLRVTWHQRHVSLL